MKLLAKESNLEDEKHISRRAHISAGSTFVRVGLQQKKRILATERLRQDKLPKTALSENG